jgi:glycosyltransferase involved in cell wall biosynthesis
MKILLCHNYYQQRGGEDQSFEDEAWLLEQHGHQVVRYTLHNDAIHRMSRIGAAAKAIWNRETYRAVRDLIVRERPAVMHCTNVFPLLSPSIYYAARAEHIPVVQSLRNYRLLCPNGLFLREGRVCEDCLGKIIAWPAVVHRCYQASHAGSAVVAGMLAAHRALRTWQRTVDLYFTPSEFARRKYIEAGFPDESIAAKPNFVRTDPGPGTGAGGYALFVGRLSVEKGIETLLAAWRQTKRRMPLKIVGDGPLAERVQAAARENPEIAWLGPRPQQEVLSLLGEATFLVMPSVWYETFGRVVAEAFAKGTPAIVSRMGSMAELVDDGRTGYCFEPASAADLAATIDKILSDRPALEAMRRAARREFVDKYTADANYPRLISLYERALTGWSRRTAAVQDRREFSGTAQQLTTKPG